MVGKVAKGFGSAAVNISENVVDSVEVNGGQVNVGGFDGAYSKEYILKNLDKLEQFLEQVRCKKGLECFAKK